jgi:tetratricopeptide (TPR) repeat protein
MIEAHQRIAQILETQFPALGETQPELLAQHYTEAGLHAQAVPCWQRAGQRALGRSAPREAVGCIEQALSALQHLPASRETIEQDIDLRFDLRRALAGFNDEERIREHLRHAETLAQALGDQRRLGWVYSYMTRSFCPTADYDRAIATGERALAIAAALGDVDLQVATQGLLGQAFYFLGDYARAIDILRRNVASLEGELLHERFGQLVSAAIFSRTWLVASLAELGAFAEGIARSEEADRIAESVTVNQLASIVQASFGTGLVHLRNGDLDKAIAAFERGLELCQVWNIENWRPNFASHLGYAYALSGRVAEAVPLLEQAMGPNVLTAGMGILWMAYRSEAYLLAGRSEEASQLAGRALELARQHNERAASITAPATCGRSASPDNVLVGMS